MELIKKQFELITTTASTTCDEGVVGPCYRIIPDTSVNYNIKILLTARDIDFGFFDILIPYGYGYGYYGEFEGIGESLLMDDEFI